MSITGLNYGVTFSRVSDNKTIHTIDDWGIYLAARPDVTPPEPKTTYVEIPGGDGSLDLTEALTGDVKYQLRTINLTFTVLKDRADWTELYSDILYFLHGQRVKCLFDEDHQYYYLGRFTVNQWESDRAKSKITITGSVDPYKYNLYSSVEQPLWDSFDFEHDSMDYAKDIQITAMNQTITLLGSRRRVTPTITVKSTDGKGIRLYGLYGGRNQWFSWDDGTFKDPRFTISDGIHQYKTGQPINGGAGTGSLTVAFQGGRL